MRIKVIDYDITSSLSVKDIAVAFREGIRERHHGLTGYIASRALEWDFYAPDQANDPFATLDDDQPDFVAGATYGLKSRGLLAQTTFAQAMVANTGGAAEIFIWDRGAHREARLRQGGDLSPASKLVIRDRLRPTPRV